MISSDSLSIDWRMSISEGDDSPFRPECKVGEEGRKGGSKERVEWRGREGGREGEQGEREEERESKERGRKGGRNDVTSTQC